MKISIQSPGIRKTRVLIKLLQHKFSHLGELCPDIQRSDVLLKKDRDDAEPFVVEALLAVPGNDLFALHRASSFEAAVEKVERALTKQIEKHKSRLPSQRRIPPIDLVMGEWTGESETE